MPIQLLRNMARRSPMFPTAVMGDYFGGALRISHGADGNEFHPHEMVCEKTRVSQIWQKIK
jgi:hypothetical protein